MNYQIQAEAMLDDVMMKKCAEYEAQIEKLERIIEEQDAQLLMLIQRLHAETEKAEAAKARAASAAPAV